MPTDAHLDQKVGVAELRRIRSRFSMPTPCSPSGTADFHAKLQDVGPASSAFSAWRVVGVIEDQRMQIAVSGMEDIYHFQAMAAADPAIRVSTCGSCSGIGPSMQ